MPVCKKIKNITANQFFLKPDADLKFFFTWILLLMDTMLLMENYTDCFVKLLHLCIRNKTSLHFTLVSYFILLAIPNSTVAR